MTPEQGHLFETPAPMPTHKPLIGHTLEIRDDILKTFTEGWLSHGDVVQYWLGPRKIYVVSTPELIQEILITRRDTFVKNYMLPGNDDVGLKLVLGNGLLTNSSEESWFVQRRMMQPMFHRKYLASLGDKMVAAGERLLEHWQSSFEPEHVINIGNEMTRATLDIINKTMFSADVDYESDDIGHAVNDAAAYVFNRLLSPIKLPLNVPTPGQRRYTKAMEKVDSMLYQIIAERRASREAGQEYNDLLDMLLDAEDLDTGERMSDQQLRDEIATIFGAGHDTTAHTLTWAWYLLAQNPKVQSDFFKQIDSVLQGRTPTVEDLANLPLAGQIFHEALRLYPAAPLIIRIAHHDTLLGDYDIQAGNTIMIDIYNIHHHPDYWENPHIFDPERWSAERSHNRHKHAFMPFGAGPRMCIGNNLALMEGSLLLALIAQRYQFECASNTNGEFEVAITLRPKHGMHLRIIPRT